jgi:hypothetical protein
MGTLLNGIKKRLASRTKTFPCPICGVTCTAREFNKGANAELSHPKPWCDGLDKGTLLSAYVALCKPNYVYTELDMPKAWKD